MNKPMKRLLYSVIIMAGIGFNGFAQQSLSLADCKSLALEQNFKIRIAKEDIGTSEALSLSARTNFFPNISANGLYNRSNRKLSLLSGDALLPVVPFSSINPETGQFDPNLDPANTFVFNPISGGMLHDKDGNPVFQNYTWLPQNQFEIGNKNLFMAGVNLTQPIYMGGKIRELYRVSKLNSKISELKLTQEQNELMYSVEENYWRVISVQEKTKMLENYINLLSKLKTDLEELYNEGIILKNDILRVNVKTNEAQLNLFKATNGLKLSQMALCQLIGMPFETEILLADTLGGISLELPETYLLDSALVNRPEFEMLNQATGIAQAGVNIMRSRYLPNIGLTAGYSFLNPNPYNGFSNEFGGDWNVGIAINIPIFHWNDRAHTMRAALHEQKKVELQLDEARELISLQLKQAQFQVAENQKKIVMATTNLELANENLRITQNSFTEGMVKTTDVLEAQALWFDAYSNLIDAQMENQLSIVNLKKVMGKPDYN